MRGAPTDRPASVPAALKRLPRAAWALGLVAALALAPAAAGAGWIAPQNLSLAGQAAAEPRLAMDAAGNATAIWQQTYASTTAVRMATRPRGGPWSAPQTLATGGDGVSYQYHGLQLAVNADGDAVAVWVGVDAPFTVWATARTGAGGTWSAPQRLSATGMGGSAAGAQVAINAAGDATVVWPQSLTTLHGSGPVQAASRPASTGTWSAPQDVSGAGVPTTQTGVAIGTSGDVTAVWQTRAGVVQTATGQVSGGGWTAPQDLASGASGQLTLGGDGAGDAIAAWTVWDGSAYQVTALARPASTGVWSAPEQLTATGGGSEMPRVAFDGHGRAVVAWYGGSGVQAISWTASTTAWGTPESVAVGNTSGVEVAMAPAGATVLAWRSGGSSMTLRAAFRAAGGAAWGDPVDLSVPQSGAPIVTPVGTEWAVALDPLGYGAAVWTRSDGSAPGSSPIAQATSLDTVAPVFGEVVVPSSGEAGAMLVFRAATTDADAGLSGAPTWSFGDGGAPRTGVVVEHPFASPGTYGVTVTQDDAAGNRAVRAGTVTVTAAANAGSEPPGRDSAAPAPGPAAAGPAAVRRLRGSCRAVADGRRTSRRAQPCRIGIAFVLSSADRIHVSARRVGGGTQAGAIVLAGRAGAQAVILPHRLGALTLHPGVYVVSLRPDDPASSAASVRVRVSRAAPHRPA